MPLPYENQFGIVKRVFSKNIVLKIHFQSYKVVRFSMFKPYEFHNYLSCIVPSLNKYAVHGTLS